MPDAPQDFIDLLPKPQIEPHEGPIYWLWVFDPISGKVAVTHNEDRPRQDALTHRDLANGVPHQDRVHGYAYPIKDGVRITDWEHKPVTDPYIIKQVVKAIKNEAV